MSCCGAGVMLRYWHAKHNNNEATLPCFEDCCPGLWHALLDISVASCNCSTITMQYELAANQCCHVLRVDDMRAVVLDKGFATTSGTAQDQEHNVQLQFDCT